MKLKIPLNTPEDEILQAQIDSITSAFNADRQARIDKAVDANQAHTRSPYDPVLQRLMPQPAAPPPQRPQAPPPYQPPPPTPQMPSRAENEEAEIQAQIEECIRVGNVAAIGALTLELAEVRRNG